MWLSAAFHRRRIRQSYRVLVFDGVVLARKTGAGAVRRPVLVALGIRHDGRKEIIDFRQAQGESTQAWEAFLNDLYRRGLGAEGLELICSDGGTGLRAALPLVYPHVPVQLCWAHKARNILDKVRRAERPAVKHSLRAISHASGLAAARRAAARFVPRWESLYPRAVACLRANHEDLLHFFAFSAGSWRTTSRTTNAIERRFREVRRRTRPTSCAFGMATLLEADTGVQLELQTEGMKVAIDGKRREGSTKLEPGKHLVLAFTRNMFGHEKEKAVRFMNPKGFKLRDPLNPAAGNPWAFIRLPQYDIVTNDIVWLPFRDRETAAGRLAKDCAEQSDQWLTSIKDFAGLEQALGKFLKKCRRT